MVGGKRTTRPGKKKKEVIGLPLTLSSERGVEAFQVGYTFRV
jgi:hypothetical protein